MMGGSVYRGYDGGSIRQINRTAVDGVECSLRSGRPQALLASGVPVFMMPLDSTQIRLTLPN